jgi:hypothetical protein
MEKSASAARSAAQMKSRLRAASCDHPEDCLRLLLLQEGGFVEICILCMSVVDLFERELPDSFL